MMVHAREPDPPSVWYFHEGVRWRVSERDARGDPGALRDWCLIFASDEAVRRVWEYPPYWRRLSREALIALSWGR